MNHGPAVFMKDFGSKVEGILYDVTDADLHKLGSAEGGYDQIPVTVTVENGQRGLVNRCVNVIFRRRPFPRPRPAL